MVKRGAVILIVTFLLLCVAAAAVETDQASLELKFAGEDLKAVVGYKNPASIVTPEPRYEWYGIGGKISEITSDKLPRIYFKKGDTIICKYRDTNNAVELRETIEIPNFAPVIENIEPISARQGKIINIVPKVTDVDNDKLFLTFTEPFDEEGRWENTIKYDPGIYTVTVTVSDGQEMVSQEVIVNLTEEYSDERESILERKLEYEDEVAKAELVRARRESKQFSQSKPGIELEFAINNPSIVLSKILFNVNKELLRYNLDIEGFPLSSRPRQYSKAPGQVYQYVETSIFDAENEDFENVSLTFMIGKNWFADNGISQYSVKLYEYFEGEWESMGAAKINDIGDAYTYEVKSDTLEGMYAVSAEGEYLPTGAAVDEDGLDFEIVNDGAGELTEQEALDRAEETELGADEAEAEEKEEKESGFLSKAIIAIIILAVLAGLYFVFSGRKTSEDFAGGEKTGDREDFAREVKASELESRRAEREAKEGERQRLAEEKRKQREEEERQIEEERQRKKEVKLQRQEEERRRRQQERDLEVEKRDESRYDDLSEAALIEERRRLARLEDERSEREAMRRQEQQRIKEEEEIRMKRRARATTKKPEAKKPVEEKPKKSNIKIISEDEWKDKMKKKKDDDELTIEHLDDDL